MSTPISNEEILADQPAFVQAYQRARERFGQLPGVAGVGFGLKQIAHADHDAMAIVIFVDKKIQTKDLPEDQRIPPLFENYLTDVREVTIGTAQACDNTQAYDHIQGGIQIMGKSGSNTKFQGTLGCIVKRRNDAGRENVYLLTNKHVLFSEDYGTGEYVYHPTESDNALGPIQTGLYGNVPYPPLAPEASMFFIDCATARIDLDSRCYNSVCSKDSTQVAEATVADLQVNGVNTLSDVRSVILDPSIIHTAANPVKIFKVGRTTGRTVGKVTLVGGHLLADPEPDKPTGPRVNAENTIVVVFDTTSTATGQNCKGQPHFSEQGDSGSVLVDEQNRVIGLHTHRSGLESHACHILPVLDYLGICIPVTSGTSHGSSLATNGSGAAPIVNQTALLSPQIGFLDQTVESNASSTVPLTQPLIPIAQEQQTQLQELLAEFRSTQQGRLWHSLFAEVRREIGYLVRNCRPVKVAWHRNQGPAYLAQVLKHLTGQLDHLPIEIQGVSRDNLLTHMRHALIRHGSQRLGRVLTDHGDELQGLLARHSCRSIHDCIAHLQAQESV